MENLIYRAELPPSIKLNAVCVVMNIMHLHQPHTAFNSYAYSKSLCSFRATQSKPMKNVRMRLQPQVADKLLMQTKGYI